MGVKLLHTFVRKYLKALAQRVEVSPASRQQPRRTILADAYGFFISLADEVVLQEDVAEFVDADVVGGELQSFDEALWLVVQRLDTVYNIQLVFAVDGPRGLQGLVSDRDAVWDHRAQQQQEALLQHVEYCQGISAFKHTRCHQKRTLPRMLMTQMLATLRRLGVPVLQLDDEVDSSIGALVHELNPVCVLTSDTDLMVTPGIPVVMNCDFPFDVLLQLRDNAAAPTLQLPVIEAVRLAALLQLTVDELLIAASMTGNDVTAPNLQRAHNGGIQASAALVRRNRNLTEGYSSLVQTSVERYQLAARRIAYEPNLPDDVKNVFESFVSRNIPVSLVSLLINGLIVDDAMPLLNGSFGFVHDLSSFRTLRFAVAHMLGRTDLRVMERGVDPPPSASSAPARVSFRFVQVDLPETIRLALPHWSAVSALGSVERRITCIASVFSMLPDVGLSLVARDSDGAFLLLMWTLHSALVDKAELEMVVSMMVIVRAAVCYGDTAAQYVMQHLPRQEGHHGSSDGAIALRRPKLRVLELSMLFAAAYGDTRALLKLMDLCDALTFPEPMHVFSGTLLHALSYFGPLTRERLCRTVGPEHNYDNILASIHELMAAFEHSFACTAFRSNKEGAVGSDSVPSCDVRTVAVSRIYSWAGVLQRDEVIDTLEAGGTSRILLRVPAASSRNQQVVVQAPPCANTSTTTTLTAAAPTEDARPSAPCISARSTLPIDEHIPLILAKLKNHRVLCIQGDTGCGKSSMIPLHVFLEAKRQHRKVRIVVTQPRRLATEALANRVASLLGEKVGDSVGYRLGGGVHVESSNTSIYFVTSGYLLESLVHSSNIWAATTHLMLDEVHERSLGSDMLGLVLRLMLDHDDGNSLQTRARSKRLIVMSATIQSELFMNYFRRLSWDNALPPLLHVGGKSHRRVTEMFFPELLKLLGPVLPADIKRDLDNYLTRVERCKSRVAFALRPSDIRAICHIVLACAKEATCVLVFLPGLKEIEDAFDELSRRSTHSPVALRVLALHSIVDPDDQRQVLIPATSEECKVVFSTNIAETSITIPDVQIVLDLGFSRSVAYDESSGLQRIRSDWCSKAAARQRAGRAGRVSDGQVMRLYTERVMTSIMPEFDGSDFYPLEASVLQVLQHLGSFGDVEDIMQQLVEPPPPNQVALSLERLVEWGAIRPGPHFEILPLGHVAGSLPIDVKFTKVIMNAAQFGCGADMAVIACGLMQHRSLYRLPMRPFFNSDYEFQQEVALVFRSIAHFDRQRMNDLYQFLAVFEESAAVKKGNHLRFCEMWNLSFRQLRAFQQTCRLVCRKLVHACHAGLMVIVESDVQNMNAIISGAPLRFNALRDPLTDELLQIVLCQSSDRMLVGCATPNEAFANAVKTLPRSAAAPGGRDVVHFQGTDRALVELRTDTISAMLAAFGTVASTHKSVHRGECNIVSEMTSAPPSSPIEPRAHFLSISPSVAAICRFGKLHPSRKHAFASAHVTEALAFPAPSTSTSIEWHVRALSSVDVHEAAVQVRIDRWSIVGNHATCDMSKRTRSPSVFGCAFGMMRAYGLALRASTVMLLSDSVGLPMLAALCRVQKLPMLAVVVDVDRCVMIGAKGASRKSLVGMWPLPPTIVLQANLIRCVHHGDANVRNEIVRVLKKLWDITQALGRESGEVGVAPQTTREIELVPRKYAVTTNRAAAGSTALPVHLYDVSSLLAMHSGSSLWGKAKVLYLSATSMLCLIAEVEELGAPSVGDSHPLESGMQSMHLDAGVNQVEAPQPPIAQLVTDVVAQPNQLKGKRIHRQRVLHYCWSMLRLPWSSADADTREQWCESPWGTEVLKQLVECGWMLPVSEAMMEFTLPKKGNLARDNTADVDWINNVAADVVDVVRTCGLPQIAGLDQVGGVQGKEIVEAVLMQRSKTLRGDKLSAKVKGALQKQLLNKGVLDALVAANFIAAAKKPGRFTSLEAARRRPTTVGLSDDSVLTFYADI